LYFDGKGLQEPIELKANILRCSNLWL